jgi:hypothetical protein
VLELELTQQVPQPLVQELKQLVLAQQLESM